MNIRHLMISVVSGLTIILMLFFISEYSEPETKGKELLGLNSDQLRTEVNAWNSRRWSKGDYESLSATIQNTKVVASEKERENLQLTLDGYYCNSMKLSFEDWKSQGCNKSSENPRISDLVVEMNEVVNGNEFRPIDIEILKPFISQYNDIRAASSIEAQVLAHIGKEYNSEANDQLKSKVKDLSLKEHVKACPQIRNELSIASSQLSDFEDFVINFEVKRKKNSKASNRDFCEQLRRGFPDVDKYEFYWN
jgi:hypothetical protein